MSTTHSPKLHTSRSASSSLSLSSSCTGEVAAATAMSTASSASAPAASPAQHKAGHCRHKCMEMKVTRCHNTLYAEQDGILHITHFQLRTQGQHLRSIQCLLYRCASGQRCRPCLLLHHVKLVWCSWLPPMDLPASVSLSAAAERVARAPSSAAASVPISSSPSV